MSLHDHRHIQTGLGPQSLRLHFLFLLGSLSPYYLFQYGPLYNPETSLGMGNYLLVVTSSCIRCPELWTFPWLLEPTCPPTLIPYKRMWDGMEVGLTRIVWGGVTVPAQIQIAISPLKSVGVLKFLDILL